MALTVVVRSGDAATPPQISFDAPRIVIGRGEGCEVRLPDPSVSHRHASIRQRGTDYIVVDEGSTNGTFVGPVRLSPQAPRVLRTGDLIRVGRIWLEVRIEQIMPTLSPQLATKEIALGLVARALAAQGELVAPELHVVEGPDRGRKLQLAEFDRSYVIGRGPDLDLSLSDPDASRRHVQVQRRGDALFARDLGSKNGSKLGGAPLSADRDQAWLKDTLLELGATQLVYEDPLLEALTDLERSADELMRDDDSIEPPPALASSEPDELVAGSTEADSDQSPEPESEPAEDRSKLAASRSAQRDAARRSRWSDWIVAGVALLVLTISVLGLFWLFKSD